VPSLRAELDPDCDLIVAWSLVPAEARNVFRAEPGIDDAT
jgi:hypothetical protein